MRMQGDGLHEMSSMSAKFFLDTNILIYTFDVTSPKKQQRACDLVEEALSTSNGVISFQVIQEFLNVATRKFVKPLNFEDCQTYLRSVLLPLCEVFPSATLYESALTIMQRWQYSFYDTMIIAAAMQADCTVLYTEDLQHAQRIHSLSIVNPFA